MCMLETSKARTLSFVLMCTVHPGCTFNCSCLSTRTYIWEVPCAVLLRISPRSFLRIRINNFSFPAQFPLKLLQSSLSKPNACSSVVSCRNTKTPESTALRENLGRWLRDVNMCMLETSKTRTLFFVSIFTEYPGCIANGSCLSARTYIWEVPYAVLLRISSISVLRIRIHNLSFPSQLP